MARFTHQIDVIPRAISSYGQRYSNDHGDRERCPSKSFAKKIASIKNWVSTFIFEGFNTLLARRRVYKTFVTISYCIEFGLWMMNRKGDMAFHLHLDVFHNLFFE
jgi:hypothetical protein